MTTETDAAAWRRCVLSINVLDDLDVQCHSDGALVTGSTLVPWAEVAAAAGPADPGGATARFRVGTALRLAALVNDLAGHAVTVLARHLRPLALPPGHPLHPGQGWRQDVVGGGVLDLGVGLSALPGVPASSVLPVPVPPALADAVGLRLPDRWGVLRGLLERSGTVTADRLRRDGLLGHPGVGSPAQVAVIRPFGGCDALTLLGSHAVRAAVAGGDGTGMRAVAVPTRSRAWFDGRRTDPAYLLAAWHLTAEPERGLASAVLLTRDELSRPGLPRPSRGRT